MGQRRPVWRGRVAATAEFDVRRRWRRCPLRAPTIRIFYRQNKAHYSNRSKSDQPARLIGGKRGSGTPRSHWRLRRGSDRGVLEAARNHNKHSSVPQAIPRGARLGKVTRSVTTKKDTCETNPFGTPTERSKPRTHSRAGGRDRAGSGS